jgi:hypothetical protein
MTVVSLRGLCMALGVSSFGLGCMLLPLSVWWAMIAAGAEDAIIGGAGMITGAILCGSGLFALTVLAATASPVENRGVPYDLE